MRSRIPTGRHVEALSLCPAARPGFPDRNALVSRFPTPEHIRKEGLLHRLVRRLPLATQVCSESSELPVVNV